MRKHNFKYKLIGKLNLAVALMAVLSALSLFELPMLHALHHRVCDCHIASAEHSSAARIRVKKDLVVNPYIHESCPICSAGGHLNQMVPHRNKIRLCYSNTATVFAENSTLHGIKLIYSRQRAPPVV